MGFDIWPDDKALFLVNIMDHVGLIHKYQKVAPVNATSTKSETQQFCMVTLYRYCNLFRIITLVQS